MPPFALQVCPRAADSVGNSDSSGTTPKSVNH
jgi:hypothetical protein